MFVMKKRSLSSIALLMFSTLNFYSIYWWVVTKNELNKMGAKIPTAWLRFIPIASMYFHYKYAQAFSKYVDRSNSPIAYFVLIELILSMTLPLQIYYNFMIKKSLLSFLVYTLTLSAIHMILLFILQDSINKRLVRD